MQLNFIKHRIIYLIFFGILMAGSVFSVLYFGLKPGIDFTGGSILEIDFEARPSNQIIQEKLKDMNLADIVVQPTGEKGVIIRMREIDENTHQGIISKLGELSKIEEKRFESVGPVIGKELTQKTIILIIISLIALLIYIAISFRKVTWPVSGFQYGIISIVTLTFDVSIPVGILTILGKFYNVQFSISIVTALLTILGYTINDKVIVFDRVRENVLRIKHENFENLLNQSLNQILTRSLSTGSCTLLVLFAIFFLGGETLRYFSLTLIIGIIVGTFTSLFLAPPLLLGWLNLSRRKTSSR